MGKFKLGSKNIEQLVELEELTENVFVALEQPEPEIIEKEVIKEVIVEKIVPVEKIVNVHTVDYKTIEVPVEVIKEVIVEKIVKVQDMDLINELEQKLNQAQKTNKNQEETIFNLGRSNEIKKEHLHQVREEHGKMLIEFNKEKSKSKVLSIALGITAIIAILGVIF